MRGCSCYFVPHTGWLSEGVFEAAAGSFFVPFSVSALCTTLVAWMVSETACPAVLTLCPADICVSDVEICRSFARTAINSSLECVNPCGLPPEDRLLLSMSPHVLVPGAWEQEERNAAHKQQQQLQQQQCELLPSELGSKLSLGDSPAAHAAALRAAVADVTDQQHIASAAVPPDDPLSASQLAAPVLDSGPAADAGGVGQSAAAACNEVDCTHAAADAPGTQSEPEFTDPLRRRTLQGDDGLLGDEVGLSEAAMVEQEVQDAAALAALPDLPRSTQGLQLYDRYVAGAHCCWGKGLSCCWQSAGQDVHLPRGLGCKLLLPAAGTQQHLNASKCSS